MEEGEEKKEFTLTDALFVDCINGFAGFDVSESQGCIYLGQPFLDEPIMLGKFPSHEIRDEEFLSDMRAHLPEQVPKEDVYITDYLGRNFLTIKIKDYKYIPEIINACLASGTYRFITHNGTPWKVLYQPGEQFSRTSFEHKLIQTMREQKAEMERLCPGRDVISILFGYGMRTYTKHWNWATEEGRAFCSELRGWLRKRKPVSTFNDRFNWPKFREQMEKHQIGYAGGWSKYEPKQDFNSEEPSLKKHSPGREDQEICMICLDRKASTLVLPCMHQVVCEVCSKRLERTPDNNICVQCRCAITSVFYPDGKEITKKNIKTGE